MIEVDITLLFCYHLFYTHCSRMYLIHDVSYFIEQYTLFNSLCHCQIWHLTFPSIKELMLRTHFNLTFLSIKWLVLLTICNLNKELWPNLWTWIQYISSESNYFRVYFSVLERMWITETSFLYDIRKYCHCNENIDPAKYFHATNVCLITKYCKIKRIFTILWVL